MTQVRPPGVHARAGNEAAGQTVAPGASSTHAVVGAGTVTWREGSLVSYDRVPYESHPFAESHPDRLATVSMLLGLEPPPVESARVLELGCASGGNLVPMADQLPGARFLGIDGSRRQIDEGRCLLERSDLGNIELRHQDILEFADEGPFDYIICHGVYSWVAPDVQERILQVIQQTLAPNGIAYVSYNTYPGWHVRGMVRELMRYRARSFDQPEEQLAQARDVLEFVAASVLHEGHPLRKLLQHELEEVRGSEDWYLFHDHMEEYNDPVYFYQFAARAERHGLRYVGDADVGATDTEALADDIREKLTALSSGDVIQREQYLDFLQQRTLRSTLLCRNEMVPDRSFESARWDDLWVATHATPNTLPLDVHSRIDVQFRRGCAFLRTNEPLVKAALMQLIDAWPNAIHFPELVRLARDRSKDGPAHSDSDTVTRDGDRLARVFRRCSATSMIDLRATKPKLVVDVSECPEGAPLARVQARCGRRVTNRLHQALELDDLQRQVLLACDGQRDPPRLASEVVRRLTETDALAHAGTQANASSIRRHVGERLPDLLSSLGRKALLVG